MSQAQKMREIVKKAYGGHDDDEGQDQKRVVKPVSLGGASKALTEHLGEVKTMQQGHQSNNACQC